MINAFLKIFLLLKPLYFCRKIDMGLNEDIMNAGYNPAIRLVPTNNPSNQKMIGNVSKEVN